MLVIEYEILTLKMKMLLQIRSYQARREERMITGKGKASSYLFWEHISRQNNPSRHGVDAST